MRNFVNKFQFIANDNRSEITINFSEVYPIIPEEPGTPITTSTELVSSLVMSEDTAKELAKRLLKALGE